MSELTPITRKEHFLAKAGGQSVETPTPITREETFLQAIIDNGGGGGGGTGGGVLKVNVDETLHIDKTYAEIKAAFMEGIVFTILPNADGDSLCILINCYDDEEGCYLSLYNMFGSSQLSFECQTVNDYPVAS